MSSDHEAGVRKDSMGFVDALVTLGETTTGNLQIAELIEAMVANRVAHCVVALGARWLASDGMAGNRWLAELASERPSLVSAYCTANPWLGDLATASLDEAIDAGCRAIKLDPFRQGFTLMEAVATPVWELAEARDIPVYVTTGTFNNSMPFQLAEIARRYPSVSFVMGRSGRTDLARDAIPAAVQSSNIYMETCYNAPSLIGTLIDELGVERIVFASDVPRTSYPLEIAKLAQVPDWNRHAERVALNNAIQLFGLEGIAHADS